MLKRPAFMETISSAEINMLSPLRRPKVISSIRYIISPMPQPPMVGPSVPSEGREAAAGSNSLYHNDRNVIRSLQIRTETGKVAQYVIHYLFGTQMDGSSYGRV